MNLSDDERRRYPLEGVTADELAAALGVMAASPEAGRGRILRVDDLGDGRLLVQTGHQAGIRAGTGKSFLLRRTEACWSVAKVSRWIS